MKLSICCITYNHAPFIAQTIEGFLMQQTNFDFEIIVHDDASTDGNQKILQQFEEKYPGRLITRYHNTNLGMSPNFIGALQACTGEYIALCEGDDYWTDPYKLQKQVDFLDEHVDCSFSFHDVWLKDEKHDQLPFLSNGQKFSSRLVDITELANGNFIHTTSVVLRKSMLGELPALFEKVPPYDYAVCMIAARQGKIGYIQQQMAVYRVSGGSWSSMHTHAKYLLWMRQLSELQNFFVDMPEVRARMFKCMIAHEHLLAAEGNDEGKTIVDKCQQAIAETFSCIIHDYVMQKDAKKGRPAIRKLINQLRNALWERIFGKTFIK